MRTQTCQQRRARRNIERLESRVLLAAVTWDGGGDGVNWTDPNNWSTNALPGVADDVTIDVVGTPTIQLIFGSQSINSLTSNESIQLSATTLNLAATSVVNASFTQTNSTFDGSGDLTVNGTYTFDSGAMSGSGRTIIPSGRNFNILGVNGMNLGRRVDIAGTATYSSAALKFGDGSGGTGILNILPNAVLNLVGDGDIGQSNPNAHRINNNGTINRSGAGTTSIDAPAMTFTNNTTINVTAGGLGFGTATLVNNGTVATSAGTAVSFDRSNAYNPGSTISGPAISFFRNGPHNFGPGTFALTGAVTVSAGTVNFNSNVSVSSLSQVDATIGGSGDITVNGTYTWDSGEMSGSGRTIIPSGRNLDIVGINGLRLGRRVDVAGTVTYSTVNLSFGDASGGTGILNVLTGGVFNLVGDGDIGQTNNLNAHQINNAGTINRSGVGTTELSSSITLNNTSIVEVNSGGLFISTSNIAAPGFLTAGRYVVASGAALNFAGALTAIAADLEINGSGLVPALASLNQNRGRIGLDGGADLSITPQGGTYTQQGILDLSPDSVFTVNGNMTFAGTSQPIIRTEIASNASFGRVVINGNLDLNSPDSNGRFDPDLIGAFDPPSGTVFNTITATTIANGFDSFFGGVTPGNLVLLLTRPNAQTVAVEIGTGTPPPAPRILSQAFEFETREALVFTFDQDVSAFLSRRDFRIDNLTAGQTLPQTVGLLTYNQASNQAVLLLTNQLADANYRLTIQASDIANPAGVPATGGITLDFHVLKGDANRDRRVNLQDFNVLAGNFGQPNRTFSQGDFNYDGQTNLADFNLLAARFGQALAPAAAAPSAPRGERDRLIDELL